MADTGVSVVLCTFPDLAQARQIGTALVEKQLAACVNLVPKIESIYQWEGETCRDEEVLAVFKLAEAGFAEFSAELNERHPYDVPEIIALPVTAGSEGYLDWVSDNGHCSKS